MTFRKRSLFAWLSLIGLVCANVAVLTILWNLVSGPSLAFGLLASDSQASTQFLLPQPTLIPEPTPTATQVYIFSPTATVTPTPSPTATSSPTPTRSSGLNSSAEATPTNMPVQQEIKHVVIISIDGLRPDALFLANTPTLDSLITRGVYSPHAQTVSTSITLPSHASMLSGMTPEKHGILWNQPYIGWSGMNGPTLFNIAHNAGLSTAMVFGKQKLNYLVLGDSVDTLFGQDAHDPQVKAEALKVIQAGLPNLLFVHFPDTDVVGHAHGWMSENQFQAITFVDSLIGELVTELERGDYLESTLLIVTSDHGGHDFTHGDDSPEDRTIPWLAVGPGVLSGITLQTTINTYDTAATVAHVLKLTIPAKWDGRPILEMFK